jgi:hypothetical protein
MLTMNDDPPDDVEREPDPADNVRKLLRCALIKDRKVRRRVIGAFLSGAEIPYIDDDGTVHEDLIEVPHAPAQGPTEAVLAPRRHHYGFAHDRLYEMATTSPVPTVDVLRSPGGPAHLSAHWSLYGLDVVAHGYDPLPAGAFPCVPFEPDERSVGVAVEMPPALASGEAHFVALVRWQQGRRKRRPPKLRYFTLERAEDEEGAGGALLCEWKSREMHWTLERLGEATVDTFVEAVCRWSTNRDLEPIWRHLHVGR